MAIVQSASLAEADCTIFLFVADLLDAVEYHQYLHNFENA